VVRLISACVAAKQANSQARRKKPAAGKGAKTGRDESTKDLFEQDGWAKNEVTMEKVMSVSPRVVLAFGAHIPDILARQSVRMYSFAKEGQNKGERSEESVVVRSGSTFRVSLKDFMFESKKSESQQVFPADLDEIPAFSAVEIMITPSNAGHFNEGYGFNIARIRPCDFSLYSLQTPLGLSLLPPSYEESVARAETEAEANPGLRKILDAKNTGFFGRATQGSYVVKYSDDVYRFVGPKTDPNDPDSTHLNVLSGGVYAVDIRKDVLFRFTNAVSPDEEENARHACCLLDLASAAGALDFYVTHNEYLLRSDPNRSPFVGVPLIDTKALLRCVQPLDGADTFHLPFAFPPLEGPRLQLDPQPATCDDGPALTCPDLVLCTDGARFRRGYSLTLRDEGDPDILTFFYVPKRAGAGTGSAGALERTDYRTAKRARVEAA
jgi:hypothetical protein